jgi:hypothetical protein
MNAATLDLPDEALASRPRAWSIDEAPVPLVLSGRDRVTAGFRREAEEKRAAIRRNYALSPEQRRRALEMLRSQTEDQLRGALGKRNFHAFKAFNEWWFRELGRAEHS